MSCWIWRRQISRCKCNQWNSAGKWQLPEAQNLSFQNDIKNIAWYHRHIQIWRFLGIRPNWRPISEVDGLGLFVWWCLRLFSLQTATHCWSELGLSCIFSQFLTFYPKLRIIFFILKEKYINNGTIKSKLLKRIES